MEYIKKNKGFTLVELLCVLVILALLALLIGQSVVKNISSAKEEITETQEKAILNAAEKWSVENSNMFDDIEGSSLSIGLDVVFILDISGSMGYYSNFVTSSTGTKISRYEAMIEATNEALKVLIPSNADNRIALVAYGNSTTTWLPLARYYSTSSDYITWTRYRGTGHDWGTVNFPTLYDSNDNKINRSYTLSNVGTNTQKGIIDGVNLLLNTSSEEAKSRIPVVILLTDGVPIASNSNLCSICSSSSSSQTGLGSNEYYALMAGYEYRNKLQNHYQNNSSGENIVFFYTIGFGIDSISAKKQLDPGSFTETKQWNYVTQAYLDGKMSTDELKNIFTNISQEVVEAAKISEVCVTVEDLYNGGYLSTNDVKLANGQSAEEYVIMSMNEATNQYGFSLAKTEEQKRQCQELLEQQAS